MNRKKKRDAILKKRRKKESAKLAPKSKTSYISKAERAILLQENCVSSDNTSA